MRPRGHTPQRARGEIFKLSLEAVDVFERATSRSLPRRAPPPPAAAAAPLVAYTRQTSALCGTADTLLDSASYSVVWMLLSPAPGAAVPGSPGRSVAFLRLQRTAVATAFLYRASPRDTREKKYRCLECLICNHLRVIERR